MTPRHLPTILATYRVTRATQLDVGFNCLIELGALADTDEDTICRHIFEKTAVALLTESCFRSISRRMRNYWIRISLAAPERDFRNAVDRLLECL